MKIGKYFDHFKVSFHWSMTMKTMIIFWSKPDCECNYSWFQVNDMIWGFPRENMAGYRAQGGQDRDHRTPMAWQHRDHISEGHTHRSVRDCKPLKSDHSEQKPYSILFDRLMVPVKCQVSECQNVIVTLFSADTGSRPRPPGTAATPGPARAPPPGTAWTGRPGAPGAPAGTSRSRAWGRRARGHGPEVTPETGTRYTEAGQTEDTPGRAQQNWPRSAFNRHLN